MSSFEQAATPALAIDTASNDSSSGDRYVVIGAGPSGLAALKHLRAAGLHALAIEREDDVGGNWYFGRASSSTCHSTHLISSKRMTQFADFPLPRGLAPYPHHRQALQYLRDYARHFHLYPAIRFGVAVERVEEATGGWRVTMSDGTSEHVRGVIIANGHHSSPRWPTLPGEFSGELLHAKQYKQPEQLRGRRVLVIGAGNSGCDIAVEAAQHAQSAWLSMRRGYHFFPKFLFGRPIDSGGDRLRRWGIPSWLLRPLTQALIRIAVGRPDSYGLPKPSHSLFAAHPIINSQLLYHVGHGAIGVVPEIRDIEGLKVRFVDNREIEVDTIICATGYQVTFPFLSSSLVSELLDAEGHTRLFLHAFHPQRDDLFVVGLLQPNSGLWPLADDQARLIAAYLKACQEGRPSAARFRQTKATKQLNLSGGQRFLDSPRHALEVDYYQYRRQLRRQLRALGIEN